jgi:ribosome-associated translation inhibitor RaiA
MEPSGFSINCNLSNIAYAEPNNFAEAITLADTLIKLLQDKKEILDIYQSSIKSRRDELIANQKKYKTPSEYDNISKCRAAIAIYEINQHDKSEDVTNAINILINKIKSNIIEYKHKDFQTIEIYDNDVHIVSEDKEAILSELWHKV